MKTVRSYFLGLSVLTTFTFLTSAPALAGVNSKKIYDALNVQEEDITPANQSEFVLLKKQVGGLSCTQQDFVKILKKDIFECVVSTNNYKPGLIYDALLVEEVELDPATFEKSVNSALTCQKTKSASQVFYTCVLE